MKRKTQTSAGIIIPAFNEEKNLPLAIEAVLTKIPEVTDNFEIIVVNDGSTDATGRVADKFTGKQKKVRVIHHRDNQGFAAAFRTGLFAVSKEFAVIYPGDFDTSPDSLAEIITKARKGVMVVSYPENPKSRTLFRRFISKSVVIYFNILFGMNLRYFTGTYISETKLLRSMNFISAGLMVYAEAKIRAHQLGVPMREIPFVHIGRTYGRATAITSGNFVDTLTTAYRLKAEFVTKAFSGKKGEK